MAAVANGGDLALDIRKQNHAGFRDLRSSVHSASLQPSVSTAFVEQAFSSSFMLVTFVAFSPRVGLKHKKKQKWGLVFYS